MDCMNCEKKLNKEIAKVRNCWSYSKKVVVMWSICALIFYALFQMALRNSPHSRQASVSSASSISNSERRSRLYDKMEKDLDENGANFLHNGKTSQSLSFSDIFTLKDGTVTPVLKAADPPVRANVLYLSTDFSVPISDAVKSTFSPYFDKAIWFQNSSLYHFSMFHASHHITPIPATKTEIASGTDPVTIRDRLRSALSRAPGKQLYDAAMLHTSFARLLGRPDNSHDVVENNTPDIQIFHDLVTKLNSRIRGFEATVSELWYVEEYDVLALALNGRMKVHRFKLSCSNA